MSKYKNAILITVSILLLVYAGFISVVPSILTKSFNISDFEQKLYDATSIVTTLDTIEYKIKPNFDTIITLRNLDTKYVDEQPLFKAGYIEIHTTPMSIFTKNFNIKSLYMKNVTYADQILPDGTNKIAFLPEVFNTELFGAKKINIKAGPVRVKNVKITYVAPNKYKERNIREDNYPASEVRAFLSSLNFTHFNIK